MCQLWVIVISKEQCTFTNIGHLSFSYWLTVNVTQVKGITNACLLKNTRCVAASITSKPVMETVWQLLTGSSHNAHLPVHMYNKQDVRMQVHIDATQQVGKRNIQGSHGEVLCDVTPCSLVASCKCFRKTYSTPNHDLTCITSQATAIFRIQLSSKLYY